MRMLILAMLISVSSWGSRLNQLQSEELAEHKRLFQPIFAITTVGRVLAGFMLQVELGVIDWAEYTKQYNRFKGLGLSAAIKTSHECLDVYKIEHEDRLVFMTEVCREAGRRENLWHPLK